MRLQYERATRSHVLLFPEAIVDVNDTAAAILRRLPCRRDDLAVQLGRAYGRDLEGLDEFVDDAIHQKWIVSSDSDPDDDHARSHGAERDQA